MVTLVLRSDDELLHVTLYSWFISEGMSDKLVEVCTMYMEWYFRVLTTDTCRFNLPMLKNT